MRLRPLSSNPLNIWPGFVDALSALVLVMLFAFMIVVVVQSYLSDMLGTREKSLADLNRIIITLQRKLQIEKNQRMLLEAHVSKAEAQNQGLRAEVHNAKNDLLQESARREQTEVDLAQLKKDLEKLNEQLRSIGQELQASQQTLSQKEVEIDSLTRKVTDALAEKGGPFSGYRSEFFGKLKEVLGSRDDIRIVGDRFVFQSEVLFQIGSAQIGEAGKKKLENLASVLKDISVKIPSDVPWILRVDGHTDSVPIHNNCFGSNWELSVARSLSVVKFLIGAGIPPEHLVAAAFGEFHPIDLGKTPESLAHNRRIEFKLDQK